MVLRYADDFLIPCDDEEACWTADSIVRDILAEIGLEVPAVGGSTSKTQICDPKTPVEFLGLSMELNDGGKYVLLITEEQLHHIGNEIGVLSDVNFLYKNSVDILNLAKLVSNTIAGYRSSYSAAENFSKLESRLDGAKTDVFTSLFKDIFGEAAVKSLTTKQRSLLLLSD